MATETVFEQEPLVIHEQVSSLALDLFAAVVALDAAHLSRFNRLAIEHPSTGLSLAPQLQAQLLPQSLVEFLPNARYTPGPEIVVDRPPFRKVVGHYASGAAAP